MKPTVTEAPTASKYNPLMFWQRHKTYISRYVVRGEVGLDKPLLTVSNLTKRFGDLVAVKNVSFSINKGDRVAIIGANGAGKTTLAEIIAGLARPTSGTITYGYAFKESPQEGIGMQFQKSDYPSGLTVKDMVRFAQNLRNIKLTPERLEELLKIFQMEDFYRRKASKLSGGQKQKLNVLMSVLHKPELVIMDELSTGLDILAREEIIAFTDSLLERENISALIISHHFEEIEKLCNKVIAMDRGVITRADTIENLIAEFGSIEEFARREIRAGSAASTAVRDAKKAAVAKKLADSNLAKVKKSRSPKKPDAPKVS